MRVLQRLAFAVPLVGALGGIGFMLYVGDFHSWGDWLFFTVISAWTAAPYVAMAVVGRTFRAERGPLAIVCAGSILLMGLAAWVMVEAFFVGPDAQSGLVFLFIPFWQALFFLPFLLAAWGWRRMRRFSAG